MGGRLAAALVERGHEVRALVRDRSRARDLPTEDLHEGDVLDARSLDGAAADVDVAYYLIHSMGRGSNGGDFRERERAAARNFAAMASNAGVDRVVYLGGLGEPTSEHLRSRHETATILAEHGPPLTYLRAAMVVGAGSESYRTLRALVQRLPVMIAPSWLRTPTQPIAVDDVIAYLAEAPAHPPQEVQIGGPDVVTYAGMLDRMAAAMDRRPRPKLPVPLLSPALSSLWIGLVTPVDAGVARPLIEGLSTPTTVTDPGPAGRFDVTPTPLDRALRQALAEEGGT